MPDQLDSSDMDLAEKSFKTVLEADIHEDNKASRILSAMAFLTTAAAAIFAKVYSFNNTSAEVKQKLTEGLSPYLDPSELSVINTIALSLQKPHATIFGIDWALFSFAGYMVFILLGATLYLAALGPSLNLPTQFGGESTDEKPSSLLFFNRIARMNQKSWVNYWKPENKNNVSQTMADNFVYETYLIAQKVQSKVDFMSWGSALFKLALLFLCFLTSSIFSSDLILVKFFVILIAAAISLLFALEAVLRHPQEAKNKMKLLVLIPLVLLVLCIVYSLQLS